MLPERSAELRRGEGGFGRNHPGKHQWALARLK